MDFQPVKDFLDSLVTLGLPGVNCIVQKGYDTLLDYQTGYADRENKLPMRGDSGLFIYSCSKLLTCTAALQLYEKGRFLLTDPLYDYFPEYRHMAVRVIRPNGETDLREALRPITVGHLFTMTAGMDYDLGSPSIRRVQTESGGRAPTLDIVRALAAEPLWFEPGAHWRYSLAHDVLGGLVELISGRRFGEYLCERLFEPLGMTHTRMACPERLPPNMAAQYRRDPKTGAVSRMRLENEFILGTEYDSGGAGILSCAEDYARFAAAMANGGAGQTGERVLSARTIDLMRMNRLGAEQLSDIHDPHLVGYGYGLGVRTLMDRALGGSLTPLGEFGWDGAAGAYSLIDPENRISLFMGMHVREPLNDYAPVRLRNIVYACL